MKITSNDIIGQAERLAAAFPWDKTEVDLSRTPEGEYSFMAIVRPNDKFAWPSIYAFGDTISKSVDSAIKQSEERDPEAGRKAKIVELEESLKKLKEVVLTIPPYRPGSQLCNGEATIEVREPITV